MSNHDPCVPAGGDGAQGRRIAFVLGGGGHMGAAEVGMLRALLEHGVMPDVVVGTSVGALNGVAVAADPTVESVDRLASAWTRLVEDGVFADSVLNRVANLVRTRTALHSNETLRALIEELLPVQTFEELAIPFQCVAACIERAAEQWFSEGPITDAVLASAAVPGILPPVEIGGEHYLDGGIVHSIPIERAIELGATELYVLHVGRIEQPLESPKNIWEVATVAFEIARRHRFVKEIAELPDDVVAHVLPTGDLNPPRASDLSQLRYSNFRDVGARIERAHDATAEYLRSR